MCESGMGQKVAQLHDSYMIVIMMMWWRWLLVGRLDTMQPQKFNLICKLMYLQYIWHYSHFTPTCFGVSMPQRVVPKWL
jgi:hypothetical protein